MRADRIGWSIVRLAVAHPLERVLDLRARLGKLVALYLVDRRWLRTVGQNAAVRSVEESVNTCCRFEYAQGGVLIPERTRR